MVLYLVNHYLPFNEFSKIDAFIYIIIDVIIGAPVYIGLAYKLGIIDQVFGKAMINKMISKVTFGKIKLK
jgi:hypothetical protein